jgi:hypothetical protein
LRKAAAVAEANLTEQLLGTKQEAEREACDPPLRKTLADGFSEACELSLMVNELG